MTFRPKLTQLISVISADENQGYCLACGHEQYGIEPDALRVKCESCKRFAVRAAFECLLGELYVDDVPDDEE